MSYHAGLEFDRVFRGQEKDEVNFFESTNSSSFSASPSSAASNSARRFLHSYIPQPCRSSPLFFSPRRVQVQRWVNDHTFTSAVALFVLIAWLRSLLLNGVCLAGVVVFSCVVFPIFFGDLSFDSVIVLYVSFHLYLNAMPSLSKNIYEYDMYLSANKIRHYPIMYIFSIFFTRICFLVHLHHNFFVLDRLFSFIFLISFYYRWSCTETSWGTNQSLRTNQPRNFIHQPLHLSSFLVHMLFLLIILISSFVIVRSFIHSHSFIHSFIHSFAVLVTISLDTSVPCVTNSHRTTVPQKRASWQVSC